MTERQESASGEPPRDPLEAATDDLGRVQELLLAAQRGEADVAEVKASLTGYLETHRSALQEAMKSVSEETRRQALAELYKWRDQLDAQLRSREAISTSGPGKGGQSGARTPPS